MFLSEVVTPFKGDIVCFHPCRRIDRDRRVRGNDETAVKRLYCICIFQTRLHLWSKNI